MKKFVTLGLVVALTAFGVAWSVPEAEADGAFVGDADWLLFLTVDCCEDDILVTGTAQFVVHPNGDFHVTMRDLEGFGFGSGETYEPVGAHTAMFRGNDVNDNTIRMRIRMHSDSCDFMGILLVHTSTNANGDLTADVLVDKLTCK